MKHEYEKFQQTSLNVNCQKKMHMYELLVTVDAHEFVEIQKKKELEHFFSLEH